MTNFRETNYKIKEDIKKSLNELEIAREHLLKS